MLEAGIQHGARVSRETGRRAPVEYSDAVEMWARGHGGHAKLKYMPDPMNVWAVILSYKVGDPRQAGPDDGEAVLLHDWQTAEWWKRNHPDRAKRHHRDNAIMPCGYAYELDELGVSGIIARLDKGNILSGSALDPEQRGRAQVEKSEAINNKRRLNARDEADHRAKDRRRSLLKIPYLGVGIEFNTTKEPS